MSIPHWTDTEPSPVFTSVIDATGPNGNIFHIVGIASRLLREIGIPDDRIVALREGVTIAKSYDEAIALVERWFRVEREDDR
jgi:hypothetical protein